MLESADPYLRVDVVRALGELGDAKARGALHRQLDRDLDGRVRRRIREVLRDLGGAGKRDADRLRDELTALRTEHAELKTRVGKLESIVSPPPAKPDAEAVHGGAASGPTPRAPAEPSGKAKKDQRRKK
jgi:aminopeptidase N